MSLKLVNHIDLPAGARPAVYGRPELHQNSGRLFIPMCEEGVLVVVDCDGNQYLHTVPNLPGVDAVLASDQAEILWATVPGNTAVVAIEPGRDRVVAALTLSGPPQELAYDPGRGYLLVGFAERDADPTPFTVSVVDVQRQRFIGNVRVPGPTRQVLYDRQSDMFYVVIADPPQIMILDAGNPTRITHAFGVAAARGLRSIVVGPQGTRLFCACDDSFLLTIDRRSGHLLSRSTVSGPPDTILYNPMREHLYVAIGETGTIEVFDTVSMTSLGGAETERGASRCACDRLRHRLYVLLPESGRVAVYEDSG